jgi:outer membrane protein TolC
MHPTLASRALLTATCLLAAGVLVGADATDASPAPAAVPLTLAQAVAFATDPDAVRVAIAAALSDADAARARVARGALLPDLDAVASWQRATTNSQDFGLAFPGLPREIGPFNVYDARLRVSQRLFDLAAYARWRAARLQGRASVDALAAAREDAAATAAEAFIALQRAEAATRNRAENLDLARQLLALAQAQSDAGTATALDVTRARSALADATTAQVIAVGARDRARIDLARALGLPPLTAVVPDAGLTNPATAAPTDQATATTTALANRPDLRAAHSALAAAHAGREAVRADYLPTVGLSAAYGPNGIQPDHTINTWSVGVQATLPLIDGFAREAHLDEQAANERAALRRLRDTEDAITAEVASALIELANGGEQEKSAGEGLGLAHDEIRQAEDRFKGGLAGNIDVITAQSALVAAEDADLDAHVAVARAKIHLAHAVGLAGALSASAPVQDPAQPASAPAPAP